MKILRLTAVALFLSAVFSQAQVRQNIKNGYLQNDLHAEHFQIIDLDTGNLSMAWTQITGKPTLSTVATSGDYADLLNQPTIPAAQVNSNWNASSGVAQILNKPTLATVATSGSYDDLLNRPSIPSAQVNADWNAMTGVAQILNKPTLATVATSGAFIDLSGTGNIVQTTGSYADPAWITSLAYSKLTGVPAAVASITLNTPNVIYTTPVIFSNASGAWSATLALINQSANTVFAGPTTGSAASPTMRALVAADIPALSYESPLTFISGLSRSVNTITPDYGTTANKVAQGNDSRFTDARTPIAHASTHAPGGSDAISTGTSSSTVAIGNDTRFPASVTGLRKGAGAGSNDTAVTSSLDLAGVLTDEVGTEGGFVRAVTGQEPSKYIYLVDEFIGRGVWLTGTGTSATVRDSGSSAHTGIMRLSTSNSSSGNSAVTDGGIAGSPGIIFGGGELTYEAVVRITSLSDGTDTFICRIGFTDSNSADGTDGLFFRYTHGENSGKWVLAARNNSSETVANSTVSIVANAWTRLRIVANAGGTSAEGFVDGVSIGTVASNIPTAGGRETSCASHIIKSAGTTARNLDIDYVMVRQVTTTAR